MARHTRLLSPPVVTLLASLVALMPFSAKAEIYRWTDADGQVHFSESKPAGVEGRQVNIDLPERPRPSGAEQRQQLEQQQKASSYAERLRRERQMREQEQAAKSAERKAMEGRCADWRKRLQGYRDSQYLYLPGKAKGEGPTILTDQQRAEAEAELNAHIAEYCD